MRYFEGLDVSVGSVLGFWHTIYDRITGSLASCYLWPKENSFTEGIWLKGSARSYKHLCFECNFEAQNHTSNPRFFRLRMVNPYG